METKFFKFEKIGDEIHGIFKGFYETKYGLAIKVDDALVSLNNVVLKNIIRSVYKSFENSKTHISITYIGNADVKKWINRVKLFSVYVDGVEIKNESFKLVSNDDVSKFF